MRAPSIQTLLGIGMLCTAGLVADPIHPGPGPGPGPGAGFGRCRNGQVVVGIRMQGNSIQPECDYPAGYTQTDTAQRTGYVSATAQWTEIPGLRLYLDLPRAAKVNLSSNGTVRKSSNGAGMCSVSFRYVVDGVPSGDPNYGRRNLASDTLRSIWSYQDATALAPGRHVVTVEARSQNSAEGLDGSCVVCAEFNGSLPDYEGCSFTATSVTQ